MQFDSSVIIFVSGIAVSALAYFLKDYIQNKKNQTAVTSDLKHLEEKEKTLEKIVNEKIKLYETTLTERINKLEKKFEEHEKDNSKMSEYFVKHSERLAVLENKTEIIGSDVKEIKLDIRSLIKHNI